MSEINSSEKPLVVIDLSDSPPEAAQAGPARSPVPKPVQDALDQAGRAVLSVAQAIKDGVEPIVKAVRTSPVGETLNKILPGVFGEGGAEGVRPVRLFGEAKVVTVSDDEEAPVDKKEEKQAPVKKEQERREEAPALVKKEPEKRDERQPEKREEPPPVKRAPFPAGVSTDEDEAPEDDADRLPVAQAVQYQEGGKVHAKVSVSLPTGIYVFGSGKPAPPPLGKPKDAGNATESDEEDEEEGAAGGGGSAGVSLPLGEGGAGGQSFDELKLAVDQKTEADISKKEALIDFCSEKLNQPDLTARETSDTKRKMDNARKQIQKLLGKQVDPVKILPNGTERVTKQLDYFMKMDEKLLNDPTTSEDMKKLINERIEKMYNYKKVNIVMHKVQNKQSLTDREETLLKTHKQEVHAAIQKEKNEGAYADKLKRLQQDLASSEEAMMRYKDQKNQEMEAFMNKSVEKARFDLLYYLNSKAQNVPFHQASKDYQSHVKKTKAEMKKEDAKAAEDLQLKVYKELVYKGSTDDTDGPAAKRAKGGN